MATNTGDTLLATLEDGISSLKTFDSKFLGAASWDKNVHFYDLQTKTEKATFGHRAPVLDLDFFNKNILYTAGLDKTVRSFDVTTGGETGVIGSHEKAVRCLEFNTDRSVLISGSWDTNVKLWDVKNKNCISSHQQPDKVFAMAVLKDFLVVGTARRMIHVYDLRAMNEPLYKRDSSLRYQTRCIKIYPDASGYAVSSIEGRVAMEYFDPASEVQKNKYAFKCHRKVENGLDVVYPVNALAFHHYGTFASGGCDGYVNIWDGKNKKRLAQFNPYPTSISSLAFTQDGSTLAVASSYTFEEGEKDAPPDQIFLRNIQEVEVRPKVVPPK